METEQDTSRGCELSDLSDRQLLKKWGYCFESLCTDKLGVAAMGIGGVASVARQRDKVVKELASRGLEAVLWNGGPILVKLDPSE